MHTKFIRATLVAMSVPLAACGITPDPPPQIPQSAYGGMGDVMAHCMQYASESTCLQSTWGGDER